MRVRVPPRFLPFIRFSAGLLLAAALTTGCGDRSRPRADTVAGPTGPSPVAATSPGPTAGSASDRPGQPAAGGGAATRRFPAETATSGPSAIAFPPRNESFEYRRELDEWYRTTLARQAVPTYVDIEGDVVWTQEYLRYRVNRCSHVDAVQKVLSQIAGHGIAPVCGDPPQGVVAFPPRNESYDFRMQLEVLYRDVLRRAVTQSYADIEGAIVWTQEYLRYRVNACDDFTSRAKVLQQITGGGIAPVCRAGRLAGRWEGEIDMPGGRHFTMTLSEDGERIWGSYRDIAFGTVTAAISGDRVGFFVYFGDGSGTFEGEFDGPDRVEGTMKYDKIQTRYRFRMLRVPGP